METAVIRVSVAPLLAARTRHSEQVTQGLLGARVTLVDHSGRWARVCMSDGYEGWVSRAHLAPEFAAADEWVTLTDLWVNLRSRPDYRVPARTVGMIGTRLPLRDRQPGWLGVGLPAGGIGWLEEHRGRVHPEADVLPPPSPDVVLSTARRFLGVPYLWGGCSPLGLDCSGFVQLVYRLHGIMLPRDADQQAEVGVRVPVGETEPAVTAGDGVFFCSAETRERITHVGLALDNRSFIHAAGGDGVRINRLSDAPYGERVVAVRRYLLDGGASGVSLAVPSASLHPSGHALA
jgi:cell wall-associated NlpC family hydrolase